uniref:Uncharacterized protein n=1 Tax=Anopheles minimus TaxID=112268 RepID=A0A182W716_9DIPT
MKAFCFTLTILCAVQSISAYPRPDFAINGAVSGSDKVKLSSNDLTTEVTKTGAGTFTGTSGYVTLTTVSNALQAIGDDVVASGTALASALNTLAGESSGPIADKFGLVNTAIDNLVAVLNGAFSGNLNTIASKTGAYIGKQFTDAFTATKTTLGKLKTALGVLKGNIESAQTAAGANQPVSAAIIRARVPARSVNNVITEIRNLRANFPLITFVIDSSLDNLKVVDSFIVDMKKEVQDGATRYQTSLQGFKTNLDTEATNVNTKLASGVGSSVSSIITPILSDLNANDKYTADLATPLGNLHDAVTTAVTSKSTEISGSFTTYGNNLPSLFSNLEGSLGSSLCSPIKSVSEVQIANGGFSDFCFSKFSPRVFAQVSLTIDAMEVCFEKELSRLITFEGVILELAIQISYNTADLFDNLSLCLAMPTTALKGSCFTMFVKPWANPVTMKAYGVKLILVLCTIQISLAIPRPDFGVNAPVYGGADVALTAQESGTLIDKVNDELDITLSSGYALLTTIKTQLVGIANDFTTKGLVVSGAIDALATSTGPLDAVFTTLKTASTELITLMSSGLNAYFTELDTKLDNSITTMLKDAFDDVAGALTTLDGLLGTLKGQLQSAVTAAGANSLTKAILRKYVSTRLTATIAETVISLKANIPLVTYIIANSLENLKEADEYIFASGTVATEAMDDVNKGLEALEAEVQQYSDDTSQIKATINPVVQINFDLSNIDSSGIPDIASELNEFLATYTTELDTSIADIKTVYETHKQAIPLVSDGLGAFYSASACDHLHRLVLVLISNGKYADYCYNKYKPRTFALFDHQAREANRCVDQEITRMLKMQEILLAIAKMLVFNIEDLKEQMTLCARSPVLCNTADVENALHDLHIAAKTHMDKMKNFVTYETTASLNRLNACFSTSKYSLVIATGKMVTDINKCATDGPLAFTNINEATPSTNALPSPDFGVNATINPARTEVVAEASRLLAEFNAISSVSVSLTSGTPILTQMQMAIVSIGSKVQSSGVALTQHLQALATNNGPSISNVFNPVYGAIDALSDLTTNGLNDEMMSIRAVVPSFVTQKFNEVFGDLRRSLNQLTRRLQTLERDVTRARAAAGNANQISSTIIRNNVPARTQSDVTRALVELRLKVTEVRYMVRTTLLYLQDADRFLLDVMRQVTGFGNALSYSLFQFASGMGELKQSVVQYTRNAFGCSLAEQNATLVEIMPALSEIANFSSTLQQPLENLLTELTPASLSVRVNAFVGQFDNYIFSMATTVSLMIQFVTSVTCQLVRNTVLTLIAFGPQNEFCFNTYAARVYGIYEVHHNLASKCYEAELERLTTVAQFLRDAVDVLLYDVEDLADNLSVCVTLSEGHTTCVEQDALGDPRPDFGIDGKIAGSVQANTVATEAGVAFDLIDFKTITLKSKNTVLKNLKLALTTIGNNIAITGQQLTGKLETLAPSKGTLPKVYDEVTAVIGTLRTLLQTGLAAQTTPIEQMVGTYITDMLTDASRQLLGTLDKLSTQITLVQRAVNDAVAAYGSNTIPEPYLRRYVSPKMIYELLRILHDLKSDLPLVAYIIELTLGHLSTADAYLLDMMESVDGKVFDTLMHYDTLKQEVMTDLYAIGNAIVAPLELSYEQQLADFAFIKNDLIAMDTYEEFLKPALDAYESWLGITNRDTIPTSVETIYTNYLSSVVSLDDHLDRFYDAKLCSPIKSTVDVLVASGPWADYCFSKYSPRLLGLVSVHSNRFLMCYQMEADRLMGIAEIVDRLVVQIVYNVEDLAKHLVACYNSMEDSANCIAWIGPYYSELAANLKLQIDDVLRLLTVQTKASANRAAACIAAGKSMLLKTVFPVLLLLGVVQRIGAEPRPDFGIKATISGTQNVVKQSGKVSTSLDLVDDLDVTLTSGYKLLQDMKTAIVYIGTSVTTAGKAFTTALNTLSADRSNDVNAAFAPVYNEITAMRTLLQQGFTAQFTVLQKQGAFITKQLTDSFKSILDRLTLFSGALDRMKAGVTAARDAPGNPPNGISTTNLNRYVPSKLTFDLQDALARLNAEIPLVEYIVKETQRKLSMADVFLEDMRTEAQTAISDTKNAKDMLESDVTSISTNIVAPFNERVGPVYNEQLQAINNVQSTLQALSTYADDLKPALDSLALLLNADGITSIISAIEGAFDTYKTDVDASVASSASVAQFFVGETCEGLRSVIDALVANSPYSNFCFSKFSPRLFNQFALAFYTVSECYEFETFRLYKLQDLMALIVNMIIYDVEDLGDAISNCALLTDGAPCLTLIGPHYEKLSITVDEKQDYMVSFIQAETKFSLQRLGACITASKYTTVISVAAIISNLNTCTLNGPTAP